MSNGILVSGFGGLTEWLGEGRLYIAFSYDQGATWTRVTQVSLDPTSSYLTVREVEPGRLLVVYDNAPHNDSAAPAGGYDYFLQHGGRTVFGRFIDVGKN